jgi:L-ascorbate metabolism protein UlaG (beta-lactamase superfamily)
LKLTYFETAFTSIEVDGVTFVTDPVLGPAGALHRFGGGMTSTKQTSPMDSAVIGRYDAILLSHDQHGDNLDDEGRALFADAPKVITTTAGARRIGGRVIGLAPFASLPVDGPKDASVRVTATPARHGPPLSTPIVGDVIGFVVEHANGALYVTGDTVMYSGVHSVAAKFPKVNVVLAHLGAASYGPLRFTMNAKEAVALARLFPDATIVPVHYEGWTHFKETRSHVDAAFAAAGLTERLVWLERGVTREL